MPHHDTIYFDSTEFIPRIMNNYEKHVTPDASSNYGCNLNRSDLTPCQASAAVKPQQSEATYLFTACCLYSVAASSLTGERCDPLLSQHMLNVIRHNGYALKAIPYHTSLSTVHYPRSLPRDVL